MFEISIDIFILIWNFGEVIDCTVDLIQKIQGQENMQLGNSQQTRSYQFFTLKRNTKLTTYNYFVNILAFKIVKKIIEFYYALEYGKVR